MNAQEMAAYLRRHRAYCVLGATRIAADNPGFRGVVNLGERAGARGTNNRLARPVYRATTLGLITIEKAPSGNCLLCSATEYGAAVVAAFDAQGRRTG